VVSCTGWTREPARSAHSGHAVLVLTGRPRAKV